MGEYLSDAQLKELYQSHPEIKTGKCPTCQGAGSYTWQGQQHQCDCAEQKRLNIRYSHAGIGLIYQRLSWDDLVSPVPEPIVEYLANADEAIARGLGLYLPGPLGVGKTMLSYLILKELVKRGYDCYATTYASTVGAFTATWRDDNQKRVFADRFMRSRVLLLDDLGKEFAGRLSLTTLDYILRPRVQEARPTIITTNLSPAELLSMYGAGVLSLLVEQSIEVPVTGANFRPKAHDRTRTEWRQGEVRPIV